MNERTLPGAAREAWARLPASYPALLVFAGYYLGANLGLALTFGSNPISVLWPPNAILFAALLLAPTGRWWLVLVAALAAHLLAELHGGIPLAMVLSWFVSNVFEATTGAIAIRLLLRGESLTFGRLRDAVVFIGAAVLATFLSCFVDSALVLLNHFGTSTYWQMWRVRFSSNVVASLTLVPLIVTWSAEGLETLRLGTRARTIEAVLLAVALLAVPAAIFHSVIGARADPASLYVLLPLFLWAALRFGPLGASTSLTLVAFSAIWGTGHGTGPLATELATDSATSVQLFLFFIGASMLLLAAAWQERREAENTLRESEERLRLALASGRIGVWDWDPRATSVDAGDEPVSGMGITPRMSFERWSRLVHPEDYRDARAAVEKAFREHAEYTTEYRMLSADGTLRWIEARGRGIHDPRRQRSRLVSLLFDVTERRHAEDLTHQLARSTRLVAMGELSASIAHEVNQPLSAILANVDAAEMLLDGPRADDRELRQILGDIRADDLRASDVVRQVRELTKTRTSEPQSFGVNELIGSVLRIVLPSALRRGVIIMTRHAERLPAVRADRILVQQVLLNLLFNAIDAVADFPAARRRVRIDAAKSGHDMIEIAVSDLGPGIAPEQRERIFESFYTTKPDGMGLGLSIARTLVLAQGGKIWAESAPSGALLRFTLPTTVSGDRPARGGT